MSTNTTKSSIKGSISSNINKTDWLKLDYRNFWREIRVAEGDIIWRARSGWNYIARILGLHALQINTAKTLNLRSLKFQKANPTKDEAILGQPTET